MANKVSKAKKGVKKSFFEVNAPITATKIHLYAPSKESLENRTIKLDLTKKLRGKSIELKLRVKSEKDDLVAHPENLELVKSYIRRVMRKGTDYVEDSFITNCRDFLVQIKPLLITRKRVSRAILRELRNSAKKHIESYVKTLDAREIFAEIIANKFQRQLALKLKKIYPLALCEIRVFKLIKEKEEADKAVKEENVEEKEAKPEAKKEPEKKEEKTEKIVEKKEVKTAPKKEVKVKKVVKKEAKSETKKKEEKSDSKEDKK